MSRSPLAFLCSASLLVACGSSTPDPQTPADGDTDGASEGATEGAKSDDDGNPGGGAIMRDDDGDGVSDDKENDETDEDENDTKDAKDGGDIPKECLDLFDELDKCADKLGPAAEALKSARKAYEDAFASLKDMDEAAAKPPRDGLVASCKQSLDAIKTSCE